MERAEQLEELTRHARRERRRSLHTVDRCKLEEQQTQQSHGEGDATDDDVREAKARMYVVVASGKEVGISLTERA